MQKTERHVLAEIPISAETLRMLEKAKLPGESLNEVIDRLLRELVEGEK